MSKQLSLFDDRVDSGEQIEEDYQAIAGLRYVEAFLTPTEQIEALRAVDSAPWQDDLKRRVQHYGYKYDYTKRRVDPTMYVGPLPDFARQIAQRLVDDGLVGKLPDQLIVNEYRRGQGIAAHIDCEPCFEDEIATVSLGWEYVMDLTELDGDRIVSLPLPVGSCLVFSRDSRYRWKHGIKPRQSDNGRKRERRVSLTFRKVILDADEVQL